MAKKTTPQTVSALFNAFILLKNRLNFKNVLSQLPLAHMETMRLISQKKQILMKEVASFLEITPPSATVMINHLVKLGYIHRHSDMHDRRTIHLSLTKKGLAVMQKSIQERYKDLKKLISNLSTEEQIQLLNLFKKMVGENQ